jgi:hypothetical protein
MHYLFLLVAFIVVASTSAQAMMCEQQTLEEVIPRADAIFSGRVQFVRFVPRAIVGQSMCWEHRQEAPDCGAKVATIAVQRIWKGELRREVLVYSEDACYCLGTYFREGDEILFVVRRYHGRNHGFERIDYRTAFCRRTIPLDEARQTGLIDTLESRFAGEK